MSTRIKEHKAACRLRKFERSAIAEHTWQDGHSIEWDNAEILDTATGFISRCTKEALHIKLRTTPTCRMNRDEGRDLSPIWLSTLRDVTKLGEATRPRLSRPRSQQQRSFQPHPLRLHLQIFDDQRQHSGRHGCYSATRMRKLSRPRIIFSTRSNEGCTFLATTLCTLHWYAVNIVINTWLSTTQQDREAIAESNGPRLTLVRHSYTELWLRTHTNLFVMGLFDSLCWLL